MCTSHPRLCSELTLEFAKFGVGVHRPVSLAHAVSLAAWFRQRASMVQRLTIRWHEDMADGVPLSPLLLCAMPKLHTLWVQFHSRGWDMVDLPQLWPLQYLTGLTDLQISGGLKDFYGGRGRMAALPWLAPLAQLRSLRLSGMHLLPPAVEALRSLSAVTSVEVRISEDAGQAFPASLACLSELSTLTLSLAAGVDLAAASMTGLACLTCVELSELQLDGETGPIIQGLSTLPALEQLSLGRCDFDAEVGVHCRQGRPCLWEPGN